MTDWDDTPTPNAHQRREDYATAQILANLGATVDDSPDDDSPDDDSPEKDAALLRLLTTDQRPENRDPDSLDELLEPPASQAPTLSLKRRTHLISVVEAELKKHYRTSGSLEQNLRRMRVASAQTQEDVAQAINALTQALTGDTNRSVTADDIKHIETTLATVEDGYSRNVAAAWAATLDLETDLVTRSFGKSLQQADDPPLSLVAGRDDLAANRIDESAMNDLEVLYERALTLKATMAQTSD
jgi:transcriptional regulator with XRE-family HTH domain